MPHIGCPNQCSFCNQHLISGQTVAPTVRDIENAVETSVKKSDNAKNTEIAFFGGSFTAINKEYRTMLLETGAKLVKKHGFKGIRISTRPDCISEEILVELKQHRVTAIELGAQSMNDEVLRENDRGHTSEDIVKSSKLIKENGFELGLQMMTGLYKSDSKKDLQTARDLIILKPETLRVYPTITFEGTRLCNLFNSEEYVPQSLEETIDTCTEIIEMCEKENIKIIRLGLHASDELEGRIAGAYHPAFKELCESRIYYKKLLKELKGSNKKYIVYVNPKDVSKVIGQKRENINKLNQLNFEVTVKQKDTIKVGKFLLEEKI